MDAWARSAAMRPARFAAWLATPARLAAWLAALAVLATGTVRCAHRADAIEDAPRASLDVEGRLHAAWKAARVAPIDEAHLPQGIDALMSWHLRIGFFADRFDGMRRVTGLGPTKDLEAQLTPQRRKVPASSSQEARCVLCNPPFPEERALGWRSWRIWPNAFPYVPSAYQHVLMVTARHLPQSFSRELFADMLDFAAAAAGGRQLTLHYNGIAGNSQYHLHWQATRVVLPLQRQLDAGRVEQRELWRTPEGRLASLDDALFAGLLLEGGRGFVIELAARIVRRLETEPLTRGAYNFLVLSPRGRSLRVVLIPRRAEALKPTLGSLGPQGLGAFNLGGIMVLARPDVPADLGTAFPAAVRTTVVRASELTWLRALLTP